MKAEEFKTVGNLYCRVRSIALGFAKNYQISEHLRVKSKAYVPLYRDCIKLDKDDVEEYLESKNKTIEKTKVKTLDFLWGLVSDQQADILTMCCVNDMRPMDAADMTGVDRILFKARLYRAKMSIKKGLRRMGYSSVEQLLN